jgi:cytochrome c oxidase assembly protein subunit 15
MAKNQRFAKTLDVFGYSDLAKRLREDKSILVPEEFNAARTWTEYVNRLNWRYIGYIFIAYGCILFQLCSVIKQADTFS